MRRVAVLALLGVVAARADVLVSDAGDGGRQEEAQMRPGGDRGPTDGGELSDGVGDAPECDGGAPGVAVVAEAASTTIGGSTADAAGEALRRVAAALARPAPDAAPRPDGAVGDAALSVRLAAAANGTWNVTVRVAECGAGVALEGPAGSWQRVEAIRAALGAPSVRWAARATGLLNGEWAADDDAAADECRGNPYALSDYFALMGNFSEEKALLASRRTNFSWASIWRLGSGRLLVLDGIVMSDTRDEHVYHEMLVQPALLVAARPSDVLIIGGGEGATLREALRDPRVRSVTMVEIDEGLVRLCREHLGEMHQGSFDASRATVRFEDGAAYLRSAPAGAFDVVIVDGIDFYEERANFGNVLFEPGLYENAFRALRPQGVLAQYMSHVERGDAMSDAGFDDVTSFTVDVPSFFGAGARFTLAGKGVTETLADRLRHRVAEAASAGQAAWAYLNPETLEQSFAHQGRRLKGFYYAGRDYPTYGTWGHSNRIGLGAFGQDNSAAYVAWILTHSRRRYGTWVSHQDDQCTYGVPTSGGAQGSTMPADGGGEAALPQAAMSAVAQDVCRQSAVVGGLDGCFKCDACLAMSCVESIGGCQDFLARLYGGCMQETDLASDIFWPIFFSMFISMFMCGFCLMLGSKTRDPKLMKQYRAQREAMVPNPGGVQGEWEFSGAYTETSGDSANATYNLSISNTGVFVGTCHDADGLQEVSGKVAWPPGAAGEIGWLEQRPGVQTEARGRIYWGDGGSLVIEATFVSNYQGETTGQLNLRSSPLAAWAPVCGAFPQTAPLPAFGAIPQATPLLAS